LCFSVIGGHAEHGKLHGILPTKCNEGGFCLRLQ